MRISGGQKSRLGHALGVFALSLLPSTACLSPLPNPRTTVLTVTSGEELWCHPPVRRGVERGGRQHVRIRGAADSPEDRGQVVELASTPRATGLDVLLVVRVYESSIDVGAVSATTDAELLKVARPQFRNQKAVALVRADDGARVRDVVRAIRALKTGGFDVVVLGSIPASAEPTPEGWNGRSESCFFPEGASNLEESAIVDIARDARGRTTTVWIIDAVGPQHAYAAAICASHRYVESSPGDRPGVPLRYRVLSDSPMLKLPTIRRARALASGPRRV